MAKEDRDAKHTLGHNGSKENKMGFTKEKIDTHTETHTFDMSRAYYNQQENRPTNSLSNVLICQPQTAGLKWADNKQTRQTSLKETVTESTCGRCVAKSLPGVTARCYFLMRKTITGCYVSHNLLFVVIASQQMNE